MVANIAVHLYISAVFVASLPLRGWFIKELFCLSLIILQIGKKLHNRN